MRGFLKTRQWPLLFLVCWAWWGLLISTTQMDISMDAAGYHFNATILYEEGWDNFFSGGPRREPLYPLIIAWSMDLAEYLPWEYTRILAFIQLFCLFVTQLLTLMMLRQLNINEKVQLLIIGYLGLSPALVNAALSMYSEIAALPFVCGIILCGTITWEGIKKEKSREVMWGSAGLVMSFWGAVFVKGVFQYIFLAVWLMFLVLAVKMIMEKQWKRAAYAAYVLIVFFALFQGAVTAYKMTNQLFNGAYVFTNRFDRMLYGNAAKRAKPLTGETFWAHIASIPGEGVCQRFYSKELCDYCTFLGADYIHGFELPKLIEHVPEDQQSDKILEMAFEKIWERPGQFVLFMGIEAARMFFWESTKIGFVVYPPWLNTLYNNPFFKDGLRLIVSLVTIAGYFYMLLLMGRHIAPLFDIRGDSTRASLLLFVAVISLTYMGGYSLYSTLTRFSFPIVPVYLIGIGLLLNRLWNGKTHEASA